MSDKGEDLKIGTFFVENGIISEGQLESALDLQKDNKNRLIGEILVTQGTMTKEDLIMAMEMFMMVTDRDPSHVDEWLDQDEIDLLMKKMGKKEK
jgi:hypothetical protein